jgi:hypothetical protein
MGKSIGRFEPTPARPFEDCEHHYASVHTRIGQDILLPLENVLTYHTMRALREVGSSNGSRPPAWRFVAIRFVGEPRLEVTPEQDELMIEDGLKCLYRRRVCSVDEQVLLNRVNSQTALAKYLIEADRPPSVDAATAWEAFAATAETIRARMDSAVGARMLVLNRVLAEARSEPVEFEGQRLVGVLDQTTRVGYIECYFDHRRWGAELLAPIAACAHASTSLCDLHFLEVEEEAPIDKR